MRPVAFTAGPFVVYSYVLFLGLALAVSWWIVRAAGGRRGILPRQATDLVLAAALGGIVGARAWHVASFPESYASHALRVFQLQTGGLVFYGGLLGGAVAVALYARSARLPYAAVADVAALAIPVASAIGRLGCLAEGCCGGPGLAFAGVGLPAQLVDAVAQLALAGVLLAVARAAPAPGAVAWTYLALYPAARFGIEYLRTGSTLAFGWTQAQLVSLALFPSAVAGLVWSWRNGGTG